MLSVQFIGVSALARAGMVRVAREKAPAATRSAAAVGRGDRGRNEYRQIGDLQSSGRRKRQRRHAAGLGHEASGLPGAGGIGRSGTCLQKLFEPFTLLPWHSADDPLAGSRRKPALLAAWQADAAAAALARCARRRFRRAGELGHAPRPFARRPTCSWRFSRSRNTTTPPSSNFSAPPPRPTSRSSCSSTSAISNRTAITGPAGSPLSARKPAPRRSWSMWFRTTAARPRSFDCRSIASARTAKRQLGAPVDLRDELAALHFDAIKIRTFRGALKIVLDRERGVPGYLEEIRRAAGEFAAAARGAFGPGNGPRRLADAPRRRARRGNPRLVERHPRALVAADSRLLPRARARRHLADPRRVDFRRRPGGRSARLLSKAGTGGDHFGRRKTAR